MKTPKTPWAISEIETFRDPRGYWLNNLAQNEPSCFNDDIRIRRYRVTVYEIPEPTEVLATRLRKLWRECDNYTHWESMKFQAKKLGIELSFHDFGKDKKRK